MEHSNQPTSEKRPSEHVVQSGNLGLQVPQQQQQAGLLVPQQLQNVTPQPQQAEVADFDDLLPHVGEFGLYQKLLFIMMIPFTFSVASVYFAQIFITLVPEKHWCMIPELQNLTLEQR